MDLEQSVGKLLSFLKHEISDCKEYEEFYDRIYKVMHEILKWLFISAKSEWNIKT